MNKKKNYLIDMDGVLVTGRQTIPGADQFIRRLQDCGLEYLILTNNPMYTPRDLAHRLANGGLDVPPERIFTSAMATARFVSSQIPKGKAFIIGESGLFHALYAAGYVSTDIEPDYVILGEVFTYNFEQIRTAVRLISKGALFIATNPDPTGPDEDGPSPAAGALAALIERATGVTPYYVGKPNPFMMRSALNYLGIHSEDTIMIGDRMDTDIIAGINSGLETILVLSGISSPEIIKRFPYRPNRVVDSIADIQVECGE